jgi:hypothetical protein
MSELSKAEKIIKEDPNGKDLTAKNYKDVLTILTSEIKLLKVRLTAGA